MDAILKTILTVLTVAIFAGAVSAFRMRAAVLSLAETGTVWTLCPACQRFVPLNHAAVDVGFTSVSCAYCTTLYSIGEGVKLFGHVNGIPSHADGEVQADAETGRAIPLDPSKPAPTGKKTAVIK